MKKLKVSLIVIVLILIGTGIFYGIQHLIPPPQPPTPNNQFILDINKKTKHLKTIDDKFECQEHYKNTLHDINDFHKGSSFSKDPVSNEKWKDNLESELEAAYRPIFLRHVKAVFRGTEWKTEDLEYIQTELNELKRSKRLVSGSPIDRQFITIQIVLNKYNEIASFISSCNYFNPSTSDLFGRYPISDVIDKMQRKAILLSNIRKRISQKLYSATHRIRKRPKFIVPKAS
jgi:hypothetical protein